MYTINVNDQDHTVDVPGDKPLLWVLRENLKLLAASTAAGKRSVAPAPCTLTDNPPAPA